jgi:hypothetical protein
MASQQPNGQGQAGTQNQFPLFSFLPQHVMLHVASFLSPQDLNALSQASRHLHHIIQPTAMAAAAAAATGTQAIQDFGSIEINSDEKLEETRALLQNAPNHMQAQGIRSVTVDNKDKDSTFIGESILPLLAGVQELHLLSGWWLWNDLSRLPHGAPYLGNLTKCEPVAVTS